MDIFLLDAVIDGVLLGGVLALLALGLNLIFGVIDVVWIAYAELVMCGMYAVYWLFTYFHWPFGARLSRRDPRRGVARRAGAPADHRAGAGLAADQPALATGGLLFFLQSFATLLFGTDFRNLGVRLPLLEWGDFSVSFARLLAFGAALLGAGALYLFLKRTFLGTAIRAIAQDREIMGLMGVSQRRIYFTTSAIGGGLAGLCLVLARPAIRRAPVHRQFVRPDHLYDLRAGRARQHDRRVYRRLYHEPDHLDRRLLLLDRVLVRARLPVVYRHDLCSPAGNLRSMTRSPHRAVRRHWFSLALLPFAASDYMLHIAIQILIWGFIYTAWSMMGRFGLTSFGHGAFLGVGAYVPALLWNYYGLTPWLGIPAGMALAAALALVIGYPSFRLRVVGHYFALVTLALSQVVLLCLVAARDVTGGSLGMTLKTVGHSWYALQFSQKGYFYAIAFVVWLAGLAVWRLIDGGISARRT